MGILPKSDVEWIESYLKDAETETTADTNTEFSYNDSQNDPYEIINQIYEEEIKGGEANMPKTIDDYSNYDIPQGEGGLFWKPEEGDNRIRLVTKPLEIRFYDSGTKDSYKTTLLAEGENAPEGKKVKIKYAYLILDRERDNKIFVYEAPVTVFRQILAYATDKEYGDPRHYDVTIKRKGKGLGTEYSVIASPKKSDLTDEEVKAIAEFKQLEDVYTEEGVNAS
ncbi:MAG: hypothetical protein IPM48_15060 [Saprospiraceae bacterium]|nr:hypothetical protein [Saprospiraceae bacterium]